jgi:hypothetical protein
LGIARDVIGRLFMRGADGFAPGIRALGVDVFVLSEVQGLDEGLAEIGEGRERGKRFITEGTETGAQSARRVIAPHSKERRWRVSVRVKEHNQERSLERLVDMEVLQKERLGLGFFGEPRGRRGALLNRKSLPER